MRISLPRAAATLLLGALLTACGGDEPSRHVPCADRNPLRNLYFGDLHAHTALSFDAYGYEVRTSPDEAYGFARGEAAMLPPLDASGRGTREARLDRPLDFAALTDHVEFYAEVRLCTTPGSPAYDAAVCAQYREGGANNVALFGVMLSLYSPSRFAEICEAAGADCERTIREVWTEVQQAAERAYDHSTACGFTSFIGYEYTASPDVTNLHRNVIFRGDRVPRDPISYFEEPTPLGLWRALDERCIHAGTGCDVMVIPHNSNWSNGQLYTPQYDEGLTTAEQADLARLRGRLEPVAEIFQHKGDMECQNGFAGLMTEPDPLCDFEKINEGVFEDCGEGTGTGGVSGAGCSSRLDFLRNVFKEGLRERERLGVNPYHFGIIGSTDTHNGTPGHTREEGFPGHVGTADDTAAKRLGPGTVTHNPRTYNPGGLAAVWAEENTREALFDALRRGEAYGTSGTRLRVRFFGGAGLPPDLCDRDDLVEVGYAQGVPMGGDLPAPAAAAPTFVVWAEQDPGTAEHPGTPLQRIEIIKGWLDASDAMHEAVVTVAGDPLNGASVDEATCERSGSGAATLCAVWTDPDFDPARPSFYYARVVENPSCRWSAYDCNALPEAERPESCGPGGLARTIQERAWTSPIWYTP